MNYANLIPPSKSDLSFLTSTDPSLTTQGLNELMLLSFYSIYCRSCRINHAFLYILSFKKILIFKCMLVLSHKWNKTFLKTFYFPNICKTVSCFGFHESTVYNFLPHLQGCFPLSHHLRKDKYKSQRKKKSILPVENEGKDSFFS